MEHIDLQLIAYETFGLVHQVVRREQTQISYRDSQWSDGGYMFRLDYKLCRGQMLLRWYKNIHNDIYNSFS